MVKITKGTRADLICIVILLLLNPAAWYITGGPENVFPDAAACITMGTNILSNGLLYLPSWGHVDVGLVLPPLFPLLIGLGRLVTGDALVAARLLSTLFMLVFSVLGFYFLRNMSHRAVAVCAVLLVQLNYHYLSMALTPLAEPLFIAAALTALLLCQRLLDRPELWKPTSLLLGISTGLACLAHQIGLVLVVYFFLFTLAHGLVTMRDRLQEVLLRGLLVIAGAAILVAPYLLVVEAQTGKLPTAQRFRMGRYEVIAPDKEVAEEVREIRDYVAPDDDTLTSRRRGWMRLIPDASEMYAYVLLEEEPAGASAVIPERKVPKQTGIRLWTNFGYLGNIVGRPIAWLFLVTALLSLLGRNRPKPFFARAMLPLLIIFSLLSLSLVTSPVERYLLVLYPLVILQIFTELYAFSGMLGSKPGIKGLREGILAVILAGGLVATPRLYHEATSRPWLSETSAPLVEFRTIVSPGDPVISIVPQFALYVGGDFRYLPNDSLEPSVAYARKTGVKWLLVTRDPSSLDEAALYADAGWFLRGRPDQAHPELLRFAARSKDGYGYLFEIRP
jgi:4-amino-4-deoxy-L-arabinose transferase-like glycosyltransferase